MLDVRAGVHRGRAGAVERRRSPWPCWPWSWLRLVAKAVGVGLGHGAAAPAGDKALWAALRHDAGGSADQHSLVSLQFSSQVKQRSRLLALRCRPSLLMELLGADGFATWRCAALAEGGRDQPGSDPSTGSEAFALSQPLTLGVELELQPG